jgi:hypothetical protein
MNRRGFICSAAALPICLNVPLGDTSFSKYLPCGQLVTFTRESMWFGPGIKARMRRRGIDYGLGTGDGPHAVKRLTHSLNATCHGVDVRDGLTNDSIESYQYYFGERL